MAYVVQFLEEAGYVLLQYTGEVLRAELEESRQAVYRQLDANGCLRLLVDGSKADSKVGIFDDYEFTSEHRSELPAGIRLALIIRPEDSDHFEFVENVARNRGVNMIVFDSRESAVDWLCDR